MVSLFKNHRIAVACAAMEYPCLFDPLVTCRIYTYVFVYVIPWLCILWSCIHGFASSVFLPSISSCLGVLGMSRCLSRCQLD